ncbi:uncharacterized protein N7459_005553 [Penicillium hispanicum]|uniref:uncharacterized protein n=1 Tax=Penicillium hispanicum TaxID=1080232 RepID=UPI0025411F58|nr:uncharacterized protein N7459_005553 [Penicillium hispanicum]KAJ5579568.1 hypothetical protein N7459_005553 [Penicillium hispanicum]
MISTFEEDPLVGIDLDFPESTQVAFIDKVVARFFCILISCLFDDALIKLLDCCPVPARQWIYPFWADVFNLVRLCTILRRCLPSRTYFHDGDAWASSPCFLPLRLCYSSACILDYGNSQQSNFV